jgi:adenylate cyclase
MYDTIITQSFIYPADLPVRLTIVGILALVVCLVAATRSTKTAVFTGFLLSVLYCAFAYFTFAEGNRLYGVVEPLIAIALSFAISLTYRAATEGAQRRMITTMFERYVDKAVVHKLIDDPTQLKLGGQTTDLTILFADIKGFTSISEQLSPGHLVKLVNTYLTEMTGIIMKHRGTVDKFIGDAIMAFWGAPLPDPDSEFRSCVAALEMQKRLDAIQSRWKRFGNVVVRQRVGLNTGVSLVGNMGSELKFNYTAIGDAVNLASRLEGVNKQYGTSILLSEFTYRRVMKKIVGREIDKVQVMGRTEPVTMYELMDLADRPIPDNIKYFLDLYQDGLKAYQTRKWDEGIAYFEAALSYMQNDPVSQMYIERLKLYKLNPPEDDWNGIFVLLSK